MPAPGRPAAHPGWDVFGSLTSQELALGDKEGLLERLDETKVPNLGAVLPEVWRNLPRSAAPFGFQYPVVSYNPDKIAKPETWLDYWRAGEKYGEAIKAHVAITQPSNIVTLYALLLGAIAAGGSADDMEPVWTMLRQIQPVVGYNVFSAQNLQQDVMNGGVWIVPEWSQQAFTNRQLGSPMRIGVRNPSTAVYLGSAVPIGSPQKQLAYEFINFRLRQDVQRAFCLVYGLSPSADLGSGGWPPDFAEDNLVTAEQRAGLLDVDNDVIAARRADWTMRWQEAVSG